MSDPVYIGYYTLTDAVSMPNNARFIMYDPAGPGSYNITGALLKSQILASPVITGQMTLPAGTAALPSLTTAGDLNTGVYFPAADTVGIATGGVERTIITSTGAFLVGRTAETSIPKLQVGFANPVASPTYSAAVDVAVFNTLSAAVLQVQGPTSSGYGFSSDTVRSAGYIGYTHSTDLMEFRTAQVKKAQITQAGNFEVVTAALLGYGTGSGGTVTQATSRTTGVTLNKPTGSITLVSAAGSTTWQSFTVTNSIVAATDVPKVVQKSGTDKYMIFVTNVAAGSFKITFATTGGTTTEQPVFNFAIIKGVVA